MTDFTGADLRGSRFDRVRLNDSRFRATALDGAEFRGVSFTGVVMRGVELWNVDIQGEVVDLRINGVDVGPLIEAELDRRDPERRLLRPADPAGFRQAWDIVERRWQETVDQTRRLPHEMLHERVGEEWSFIETLRHLVFATESWAGRAILGDPAPWHPLALPWDEMPDIEGVPRDRTARPSLDTVLELRRRSMATVRGIITGLTDASLAAGTTPVDAPGWPEPRSYPVRECLSIILNEEWEHRRYAERDLAVLAGPET